MVASEGPLSPVGQSTVSAEDNPRSPAWWQVAGSVLAAVWAMGTVVGLLRLSCGYLALARFCAAGSIPCLTRGRNCRSIKRPTPWGCGSCLRCICRCSARGPVSIGLLRPAIVLPQAMPGETDDDQLQAVLLHEMAHIARRDHWVGVGQRIATVLFWWHPLVHRTCNEISELREEICDNHVVLVQGEGHGLARLLVDLAARSHGRAAIALDGWRFGTKTGRTDRPHHSAFG